MIRQRRDHLFYGDCRSRGTQNAVLPFFENLLKCVYFCLIITLFDYHWTQILDDVEEQATCMPMRPGCLSNSGHLTQFSKIQYHVPTWLNVNLIKCYFRTTNSTYQVAGT